MPKVEKQTARPRRRSKAKGVVDRIVPVSLDNDGIKLNVYGRGKTGKTRLSCTFPKPLLLIGTEKGTRSVAGMKGLNFVRLEASQEIEDLVSELKGGRFKSVVIDTAGGLQDMVLKEVLGLGEVPVEKSWGMAQRGDWQTCGVQTKERLRSILDLAESHSIHTVVIAHERNFNEEGDSDLIFPTVGAALTPSVAGWLNGACDYICQTFIREATETKKVRMGKKSVPMLKKTGGSEYCLRVGPHPVYMTGFRLPPGKDKLPDVIVNPSFDKIQELIQQGG